MEHTRTPDPLTWLTQAAPDPQACRRSWERTGLGVALLPAGRRWDVLYVRARLGRPALDVLSAFTTRPAGPGPVFADGTGAGHDRSGRSADLGFLVPAGTAQEWIASGVRAAAAGSWIALPHPTRRAGACHWLQPPDGTGQLVDPGLFELALHDAAARLLARG
ncbi:hypothetical protein [Kitasatospora camelliae]|uniref:Bifunctional DNA primase/polymerase-like protein n=1 Tax=Kitasatospora camelliae TaxID=3156397 RepID=A0AAU8K0F1_9ACTN